MAQLFVRDDSKLWGIHQLTADAYRLSPPEPRDSLRRGRKRGSRSARSPAVESARVGQLARDGALLLKRTVGEDTTACSGWSVLTGADTRLRINGVSITVGIATLQHRDELCFDGGAPLYFSTERLAKVESYRGTDTPHCPRCTLSVELGDASVCCPNCRVVYHQLSDRKCWTYTDSCALCDQTSDLAGSYQWSPEKF